MSNERRKKRPKRNAEYWKARFGQVEQAQHERGVEAFNRISEQYRQAEKDIQAKIDAWYRRFAKNNGITLAEARKMLNAKELAEFQWDVNDYIKHGRENAVSGEWMRELENASARAHISRLEALKIQCQQGVEVLFGSQTDVFDTAMRDIYREGYYHNAFTLQKGFGVGWDLASLDEKRIDRVINTPWAVDGLNFSERLWGNKEKLIGEIDRTLTQNIIRGEDPQKAINDISERLNVSKSQAGRLVMTEEAYFGSAAQQECFKELDVEEYEIVATLDNVTSEICQEMDGKVFKMSEWEVGVTAPPFHPWCRTTTVPAFDDDFDDPGERAARDADGKTYYVPDDMKYPEWKKKQDEKYGEGFVDRERKKAYNLNRDKEMFGRYSAVMGDLIPDTFEGFQKLKYEDPSGWNTAKNQYRILNSYKIDSGRLTPEQILELDNIVITEKRTKFASGFKNSGNIAGAYLDGDPSKMFFAHSAIPDSKRASKYRGKSELVLLKEAPRFIYKDVPSKKGALRTETQHDTEAKLFEYFADLYEREPFKSITMLSERGMCESCQGVMEQFKKAFPDVEVNVVSNKTVEGDVWKHRWRKKHEI